MVFTSEVYEAVVTKFLSCEFDLALKLAKLTRKHRFDDQMTIQITITQRILVNVVADKISQNSTTGFRLLRRAHTLEAQNFTTIQVTISTEMTITMQRKTNLPLNTKIELVKSIAVVYL